MFLKELTRSSVATPARRATGVHNDKYAFKDKREIGYGGNALLKGTTCC